jgi:hypothetical protein
LIGIGFTPPLIGCDVSTMCFNGRLVSFMLRRAKDVSSNLSENNPQVKSAPIGGRSPKLSLQHLFAAFGGNDLCVAADPGSLAVAPVTSGLRTLLCIPST